MENQPGTSEWFMSIANILGNQLLGIELRTKSSFQLKPNGPRVCCITFLVAQEPEFSVREELGNEQCTTVIRGNKWMKALTFSIDASIPCPSANILREVVDKHNLQIPETVMYTNSFCGVYKPEIWPNQSEIS